MHMGHFKPLKKLKLGLPLPLRNQENSSMGEIADMMIGGVMCAGCGEWLSCQINRSKKKCEEWGIPMYCDKQCALEHGGAIEQVCPH